MFRDEVLAAGSAAVRELLGIAREVETRDEFRFRAAATLFGAAFELTRTTEELELVRALRNENERLRGEIEAMGETVEALFDRHAAAGASS